MHVRSFVDTFRLKPLRSWPTPPTAWAASSRPKVFAGLPFDLEVMFGELDGTFPNHPADPIQPENLATCRPGCSRSARTWVRFDGDADRVFLVDEKAQPVSGSLTTAMVAPGMLERTRLDDPPQPHLLQGGPRGRP